MEQYEIPPQVCGKIIRQILARFPAERISITCWNEDRGMKRGERRGEDLNGKVLVLLETVGGFQVKIDGKSWFLFEFQDGTLLGEKSRWVWGKHWAIAYQRLKPDGVLYFASGGYPNSLERYTGPDDPRLPPVYKTLLQCGNRDHFLEITFAGKVPIRQFRSRNKRGGDYWTLKTG